MTWQTVDRPSFSSEAASRLIVREERFPSSATMLETKANAGHLSRLPWMRPRMGTRPEVAFSSAASKKRLALA